MRTSQTPMTDELVRRGTFAAEPFGLVDVGASGGVDRRWDAFGAQRRAWGFDPLEREIERLTALGQPGVSYHAYHVGYRHYAELLRSTPYSDPARPGLSNDPGPRFSAWGAIPAGELGRNYDATGSMRQTDERTDLDTFFADVAARRAVDFVKTDTDGHDYEVLLGASALLREAPVIGVQAECILHGQLHPHVQVFANLDRFMREAGFSLFDLSVWRYSRGALPSKFAWDSPGPTEKGQPWWGDFLYFRDLGDPAYEENWGLTPTPGKVLKLACAFESYDLADCAAEVVLKYESALGGLIDVAGCLDLLTTAAGVDGLSYREYVARFKSDPKAFNASAPPVRGPALARWRRGG